MTSLAIDAAPDERPSGYATHEVFNQPGALEGYDAYSQDKALTAAMRVFEADWADERLRRTGALIGSDRIQRLAREANLSFAKTRAARKLLISRL
jgi:putative acyl-CoA dehydrogenase